MSKYEALGKYLKRQPGDRIPITFAEIEKITGVKLPASAQKHRPWWSNNPKNSVMTKVWRDAGFASEQVDMTARKLVFRRLRGSKAIGGKAASAAPAEEKPFHPAYGAMQGMVRIMPGTDLTQPADPEWADRLDALYGPELRDK
ncbi:MAG: hypothetical protein ABSE22_11760 [Xanthobacteraceae bacterium]